MRMTPIQRTIWTILDGERDILCVGAIFID
jgi:hypothetical protein